MSAAVGVRPAPTWNAKTIMSTAPTTEPSAWLRRQWHWLVVEPQPGYALDLNRSRPCGPT
jgi:hypothetical protein